MAVQEVHPAQILDAAPRSICGAALSCPVRAVPFVTQAKQELLAKLRIKTVEDMLYNTPFRLIDFTELTSCAYGNIGQVQSMLLELYDVHTKFLPAKRLHITELVLVDNTGTLIATFFNQPWIASSYQRGDQLLVLGELKYDYGNLRMSNPLLYACDEEELKAGLRMLPVYHLTENLSSGWMRRFTSEALNAFGDLPDVVPALYRSQNDLMSRSMALRSLHFPQNFASFIKARRTLAFEELLLLQFALLSRRSSMVKGLVPFEHVVDGPKFCALKAAFPFELSSDQAHAFAYIQEEMAAADIMNHMLLGDVGTGKTAVAILALGLVADTGTQAAFMAPTSVLAQQYASSIGPLLDQAEIGWAILTGATSKKERDKILESLQAGEIQVLFGTHALIEDDVRFARLSLVIIDEQHRFGVQQRARLRAKSKGADLLVMTATPIPRTLALSIYGDLSCSFLRERPLAGAGVTTHLLAKKDRGIAYDAIRAALKEGHQAYVICPLIGSKPSEELDDDELIYEGNEEVSKAAYKEAQFLSKKVFPEHIVAALTGKMTAQEKDEVMERFKKGLIQILVSTTVVEVGVDVPNATVMIIEDADRFGLSQLHQLRGRVGRGAWPGEVYLVANARSQQTKERLSFLVDNADGFALADKDLQLRGEGELVGKSQHGQTQFRFVSLSEDADIIERSHYLARKIFESDPTLQQARHKYMRVELMRRYADMFTEVSGG